MNERLPIYDIEQDLAARLKSCGRLVLSAPTGSGKSTQVPQILLRHGFLDGGQVIILQPRRIAARLLAARVAQELGVTLGAEVGYQIRFENVTSRKTRICFVTEGVLLRRMIEDPRLAGVSVLIFDEFHERHLYGDISLGRALDLQERHRADLNLIVMSATLNAGELGKYLGTTQAQPRGGQIETTKAAATVPRAFSCSFLSSEGRQFPVEMEYADRPSYNDKRPVWEQAAAAFSTYVQGGGEGDVLVFMPGGFEISQTIEAIRNVSESSGFILLPLHGELDSRAQDAAVARHDRRKVVVATNVAETSLTIDGIRLVIDSGLARLARYDPNRGINTLLIEKISQSSADQRAGRAGRTAPGTCMRLWSLEEHPHRPAAELPEVKRLDLAEVVLTLKASGVEDLRRFRWLEKPDEQSLVHAEELLTDLGALAAPTASTAAGSAEPSGAPPQITSIGRKMLAFPLHPRYSRMLLAARDYDCVYQAALVAALTQGRELLIRNADRDIRSSREDVLGEKASSDFWILMRAWNYAWKNQFRLDACRKLGIHAITARQVGPLLDQFLRIAEREGLDTAPREVKDEALQKCILIAFSDRVARRLDQGTLRCELVHNRRGRLSPSSAVQHSPLLVAAEVHEIEGRDNEVNTILSLATAIEADWLRELFPQDIQTSVHAQFDAGQKRVVAAELLQFRGLALSAKRVEPPPTDAAAKILAGEIQAGRLPLANWDHGVEQWIERLNFLCRTCPELQLPPLAGEDKKHLIEQLCHGAVSARDIRERDVKSLVLSWLSAPQRDLLDTHAPERLALPNGRTPKIVYESCKPPFISLRIQELYDVKETPRVAMGRAAVTVHILSPGMKPVQVTQDLAGFWRDHYPRLKSELQRKYPKHLWR
ncbi:MAG: ATP-dependent helicase HrpB [Verrucomicrobia bacterium]|nr:ATP-dependent helicase HrpB [Verrucomicrobiota bacterium]MDE3098072.1 ATP-dependent helicase HrpB [Verrucomicrobiota bacterium]